jgi:hypothetical protein
MSEQIWRLCGLGQFRLEIDGSGHVQFFFSVPIQKLDEQDTKHISHMTTLRLYRIATSQLKNKSQSFRSNRFILQ